MLRYLPFLNEHYAGILKIILVKSGHGLENVRLNLFRVTIYSYERLAYQHLFYESQSQFRETHQHNLKNPSTLLQSVGKNKK
jgi:hypothetical protein